MMYIIGYDVVCVAVPCAMHECIVQGTTMYVCVRVCR